MKRIVALILSLLTIFTLSACGGNGKSEKFSLSDIVWKVEETTFEGKNTVVFSYKNNSRFTITGVEVEFKQKKNLTEDDLAVFEKYAQDDISVFYITANNYYFTDKGESSKIVPCNLEGSWNFCHDIKEYNLMEISKITIEYIKDNKMFGIEHDYVENTTKDLSKDGVEIFEWSESNIAKLAPKPNKQVVKKGFDYGKTFSFTIYDASEKDFEDYINQCKEAGFIKNIDNSNYFDYKSFKAEDANGNEIHVYYKSSSNHRAPCRIEVSVDGK
ncbi:MAG: hypothetical protein E7342_02425 [Clostridiales bacterium]|nr:hypothetical protein [Clostridiales bacterium]